MRIAVINFRPLWLVLVGAALVAGLAAPAHGQFRLFHGTRPEVCPPQPCPTPTTPEPAPTPPGTAPTQTKPPTTTAPAPTSPAPTPPATEPSISPEAAAATGTGAVALAVPNFKGDQGPITAIAFGPPQHPGGQPRGSVVATPARAFKMSEDESPQPRDRFYFDFNYYDNMGEAVSRRLGIDLHGIDVYRETFGFEKTFLDNSASIGFRLPLNTLSASSTTPGLGGTDTDIGDLTTILKYAFWQDPASGTLLSTGLAVTAPTGPAHFAGSTVPVTHVTVLQPFVGYIWSADKWFLHGFTSVAAPTDSKDVTSLFNSIGVGYIFTRPCAEERLLRTIAPTFEVHVSDPLNHRGAFKVNDPVGTADIVDLTMATTFGLGERSALSVGIVTPVTGPKPFDVEALVQFNWFFGARRNRSMASTNVIGE
ncbi:MAG TPA: hypothetical protein VKU02_19145 [Gemmataceae bacterium]|nr:hypothetical protein [Gemmataceae bacterium]